MDFTFTEDQEAVRDLAARIFQAQATAERVREVERGDERVDRRLWGELARAGLLGLCLPEDADGSGLGMVELCLVLEQQGRRVAPVPVLPTVVSAMTIAEFGSPAQRAAWVAPAAAGAVVLTAALGDIDNADPGPPAFRAIRDGDGGGWRLEGAEASVPAAPLAARVLVPAATPDGARLFLVDPHAAGVEVEAVETTDRQSHGRLVLSGALAGDGETVGDGRAVAWCLERMLVGLCALQVGVAEEAVRLAAGHSSTRIQFDRPLSAFQGVAMRAADAFIDTEAMRVTMWQAAWCLSEGLDARREVLVAKWWASEAGQRVVHATQHLHGGIGADVEYPVHRYFLWGKQIETSLGGASAVLSCLGRELARP
ncbi:MAG TPA: acyl-CoA dehydrogenase family protein [Acidimicrobiales bacterium]|nr:acyl-CoA dehydrogenase family protein [Acidimicrobiales bacterium]